MMLRELLKQKIPQKHHKNLPSSFDVIGNKEKAVAIIEIDQKLKKYYKIIAEELMTNNKNVQTVLLKSSPVKGIHRKREYKFLSGKKDTEVIHKENGCLFVVDMKKTYFSSREGTERQRIVEKVKPQENVMVFFAGIGPYAIQIAKKAKPSKVIGIEINKNSVSFFKKNIKLNKVANVSVIQGDVKKVAKKFYDEFDRVIMPLPEKSIKYLDDAIKCLKSGGTCHFYCFESYDNAGKVIDNIRKIGLKNNRVLKFIETRKVLPYGPNIWKLRIDFQAF